MRISFCYNCDHGLVIEAENTVRFNGKDYHSKCVNKCDGCKKEFATCKSNPEFGIGKGNDNVIKCGTFRKMNN